MKDFAILSIDGFSTTFKPPCCCCRPSPPPMPPPTESRSEKLEVIPNNTGFLSIRIPSATYKSLRKKPVAVRKRALREISTPPRTASREQNAGKPGIADAPPVSIVLMMLFLLGGTGRVRDSSAGESLITRLPAV